MKKKLVSMLLISAVVFSFVSCGTSDKKDEGTSGKDIVSEEGSNTESGSANKDESNEAPKGDKEEDKGKDEDKAQEDNKKEDKFAKFSDAEIIKFTNESIEFYKDLDSKKGEMKTVGDESYFLMVAPYETVAKRKEYLSKYFTYAAIKEEYKTIDGKQYVNSILNSEFDPEYNYKKILKREVDGDKMKVTFNTEVKSLKGVEDEEKTLQFKLVDGKFKLIGKSFSTAWYDGNH